VVTGWSLGGHWVVTGWSLGGHWVVTECSLGGHWVVTKPNMTTKSSMTKWNIGLLSIGLLGVLGGWHLIDPKSKSSNIKCAKICQTHIDK